MMFQELSGTQKKLLRLAIEEGFHGLLGIGRVTQ